MTEGANAREHALYGPTSRKSTRSTWSRSTWSARRTSIFLCRSPSYTTGWMERPCEVMAIRAGV